jgi:hypothetical protein
MTRCEGRLDLSEQGLGWEMLKLISDVDRSSSQDHGDLLALSSGRLSTLLRGPLGPLTALGLLYSTIHHCGTHYHAYYDENNEGKRGPEQ